MQELQMLMTYQQMEEFGVCTNVIPLAPVFVNQKYNIKNKP